TRPNSGPGTRGQFAGRDKKIYARSLQGGSRKEIAVEFNLSVERVRQILNHQKRLATLHHLSVRTEAFARKYIGQEATEITPALIACNITITDLITATLTIREQILAFTKNAGFTLRT